MKQHVSEKQLKELNHLTMYRIKDIMFYGDTPISMAEKLTIGKMIEILDNHLEWNYSIYTYEREEDVKGFRFEGETHFEEVITESEELCDALFEALKHVLEVRG